MLHDEREYPDPESFIPERFLDSKGRINPEVRDPEQALFGFGRRYVFLLRCPPNL